MVDTQPAVGRLPAANQMMFLYSDGILPIAHESVTIVALGRNSNNGRQTVAASPLLNDFEVGSLETGGSGELALDDPSFKAGYEALSDHIKLVRPLLDRWVGVPGQPTPLFRGRVNPSPGLAYPSIPVAIEMSGFPFKLAAGATVRTGWPRPAVGELDREHFDPVGFLEALGIQYEALGSRRFPLVVKLTRMGSIGSAPALEPAFRDLARYFGQARNVPQGFNPLPQIAKRVATELLGVLPNAAAISLPSVYRELLRQIARLAGANPHSLPHGRFLAGPAAPLTIAVMKGMGHVPDDPAQVIATPSEDWAALGAAVFLAGVVPLGYSSGKVTFDPNPYGWGMRAALHQPGGLGM